MLTDKKDDGLTDLLEKLNIYLFHDNFRPLIEETIKDLYYSNDEVIYLLKLSHIDRALFKFRRLKKNRLFIIRKLLQSLP